MSNTNNAIQISAHVFTLIASLTLLGVSAYKVIAGVDVNTYLSIITFLVGVNLPTPLTSITTLFSKKAQPAEVQPEVKPEPQQVDKLTSLAVI